MSEIKFGGCPSCGARDGELHLNGCAYMSEKNRWAVGEASIEGARKAREMLDGTRSSLREETDPHGLDPHAPGAKLDANKVLPWLCISGFAHALTAVADVTSKGARKYTPNGWMAVPDGEKRYMEAFGRHLLALGRGEEIDQDTQCLHKAQMIWNLLASLELELRKENGWQKPLNPK